jgi:hypothetical protein
MEIRFNPLIAAEADAVRRFLTPGDVQTRVEGIIKSLGDKHAAQIEMVGEVAAATVTPMIAREDRPDVGAEPVPAAPAASAIPLPPTVAPSTAAADLFPTAQEVPQAGIPLPPGAALPPVPPVPAAPPAPPAPAAPTNRADVDSAGLPWDARIHSESRNKVADGTWRKRRNTAPEVVARVEAELRALMAIPVASAVPLPPSPAATATAADGSTATATSAPAVVPPAVPTPPVSASPVSPVTPPVPAPPVPQPPAAAPTPIAPPPVAQDTGAAPAEPVTFASVMRQVTEGLTQHKFTEQTVNDCLREAAGGVEIKIGMLAARPDLCVAFSNLLRAKSAV